MSQTTARGHFCGPKNLKDDSNAPHPLAKMKINRILPKIIELDIFYNCIWRFVSICLPESYLVKKSATVGRERNRKTAISKTKNLKIGIKKAEKCEPSAPETR